MVGDWTKHLIAMLSLAAAAQAAAVAAAVELDAPAPDFALKSLTGPNLRLSEFRGEVVVLNFWASWCGGCREAMPALEKMHELYGRAGLRVLGITIDEDARHAERMVRGLNVSYPILLDGARQVSRQYEVEQMPVTVLIDRVGNVRYVHHDYRPDHERRYIEELRELLKE